MFVHANRYLVAASIMVITGCATPMVALKRTTSGGDAYPKVDVGAASQINTTNLNIGDTIAFAPGSMRAVVASGQLNVLLVEAGSVTQAELKKQLVMNRRDVAKIEVMKGQHLNGELNSIINIDLNSKDPNKYNLDIAVFAFNRGEKPFRGDLTLYDFLPPELIFQSAHSATKYRDQRGTKDSLMMLPYINLFAMGMNSFKKLDEPVTMDHEMLDQVHKYTFHKLILEPNQAVGFTVRVVYTPPGPDELLDLRMDARPAGP